MRIWDMASLTCLEINDEHKDSILSLVVSGEAHGGRLFSSCADRSIRCWQSDARQCLYMIKDAHRERVSVLAVMQNGDLISGSTDKLIKVWACSQVEQ
jgi:WD40 repeat protein